MSGRLYALGVGPGASDLITVRAARLIAKLDVLYAPAGRKGGDSLALSIVREYLSPHTEIRTCHFPMSADDSEKQAVWDEVAQQLQSEVANGRQVDLSPSAMPCYSAHGCFYWNALGGLIGWKLYRA